MALSSGFRGLIGEVASWTTALGMVALGIVYQHDIRRMVAGTLGIVEFETQRSADTAGSTPKHLASAGQIELKSGAHGHFFAEAEINGRAIEVMVDTGASVVALTWDDAERAGVFVKPSDFTHRVSTANGVARVAPVQLDKIAIGDITVRNVRAVVSERGAMKTTLLGMAFLGRLSKVEMRPGSLMLTE